MRKFNIDETIPPQLTLDVIRLVAMTAFKPFDDQDYQTFAGAPAGALQANITGLIQMDLLQQVMRYAMGTTSPIGLSGVMAIIGSGVIEFHGVLAGALEGGTP